MLLAKRIKQDEIETKQRQALQQQINWKLKIQSNPGTVKEEGDDNSDENETGTENPINFYQILTASNTPLSGDFSMPYFFNTCVTCTGEFTVLFLQ